MRLNLHAFVYLDHYAHGVEESGSCRAFCIVTDCSPALSTEKHDMSIWVKVMDQA